jgi:hypothetical protein
MAEQAALVVSVRTAGAGQERVGQVAKRALEDSQREPLTSSTLSGCDFLGDIHLFAGSIRGVRGQALFFVFVRPERRATSAHAQAEKQETKFEPMTETLWAAEQSLTP